MRSKKNSVFSLIFLLLICVVTQVVNGQTITATLTGQVTDSNGASVADARLVATNNATKTSFTTQTTSSGSYTIPFLPIGTYTVAVEVKGFKKSCFRRYKIGSQPNGACQRANASW